jgi:4-amino-4-deoxy-L-arabinose transferase-like glycosyltransferase
MEFSEKRKRLLVLGIALLILMVYFVPLGRHGLLEPDEGRYAEIPREMIESGDFVTPRLNYVKYFEKPVMLYWMNAASFLAFGENEFAARFPTALCAVLGALITALFCASIFGRRAGAVAGAVTALSLLYFAIGTITLTDMPLSLFMTAALCAFYYGHIKNDRRWFLAFYASVALGLLSKGLVAIVLPGGIIFWYIIFTRKWRLILDALYLPGIALFFVIAVPWFYMVSRENPDFLYFFFIREHFLRYATKIHSRYEPFWFFIPMIPVGLLPWTGFFFSLFSRESVLRSPDDKNVKDANIYLLCWFTVIFAFFSFSSSKLIPYFVAFDSSWGYLFAVPFSRDGRDDISISRAASVTLRNTSCAVSSNSMGTAFWAMMSPLSADSVITWSVAPVSFSPLMTAQLMQALPLYLGRSAPWILYAPSFGISSTSLGIIAL